MERKFSIYSGPPKAFLVGISKPVEKGIKEYLAYRNITWNRDKVASEWTMKDAPFTPEDIIVMGGRVCYDSFHNPASRTTQEYIGGQIIEANHGSVIEHVTVNLMIGSLPRSSQLELVRHRAGMAYSFRSTRFTDNWLEFIVPPMIRDNPMALEIFHNTSLTVFHQYSALADSITADPLGEEVEKTLKRKRIKEAARSLLTNAVGSDGLVSMNMRALRHVVAMRSNEHADASIREFAYAVYQATKDAVPSIYWDATEKEVAFGSPEIVFQHSKV